MTTMRQTQAVAILGVMTKETTPPDDESNEDTKPTIKPGQVSPTAWLGGMSPEEMARNLREAREEAGLSREAVAHEAGVSLRSLSRWETGEVEITPPKYELAMKAVREHPARTSRPEPKLEQVPLLELSREMTRRLEELAASQSRAKLF